MAKTFGFAIYMLCNVTNPRKKTMEIFLELAPTNQLNCIKEMKNKKAYFISC
jgi:hypothetical protein